MIRKLGGCDLTQPLTCSSSNTSCKPSDHHWSHYSIMELFSICSICNNLASGSCCSTPYNFWTYCYPYISSWTNCCSRSSSNCSSCYWNWGSYNSSSGPYSRLNTPPFKVKFFLFIKCLLRSGNWSWNSCSY